MTRDDVLNRAGDNGTEMTRKFTGFAALVATKPSLNGAAAMTRDDVLNMMAEAGAGRNDDFPGTYGGVTDVFERFAALVSAKVAAAICDRGQA